MSETFCTTPEAFSTPAEDSLDVPIFFSNLLDTFWTSSGHLLDIFWTPSGPSGHVWTLHKPYLQARAGTVQPPLQPSVWPASRPRQSPRSARAWSRCRAVAEPMPAPEWPRRSSAGGTVASVATREARFSRQIGDFHVHALNNPTQCGSSFTSA